MLFEVMCGDRIFLFINVFLPYCSIDNFPDFMLHLVNLSSIVNDIVTPYVFMVGDFNADVVNVCNHKFGKEMIEFCINEFYIISDLSVCDRSTYKYYCNSGRMTSWLDHVLSTGSANSLFTDAWVDYSIVTSDHHPLFAKLFVEIKSVAGFDYNDVCNNVQVIRWDKVSAGEINMYKSKISATFHL